MVPAAGQWRWPAAGGQGQAWPVSAGTDDAKYRASHWPENPNPANQTPPNDPIRSCLALGRCWGDPQFQPAASPPTAMTSAPTRHGPRISWRSRRSSPVLATCPSSDSPHLASTSPASSSIASLPPDLSATSAESALPSIPPPQPPTTQRNGFQARDLLRQERRVRLRYVVPLHVFPQHWLVPPSHSLPPALQPSSSSPRPKRSILRPASPHFQPSLHLGDCFWLNSSLTHISSPASPSPAQQATCSCGKQSALECNCEKATTENSVEGARCSCKSRPAGQCNCARADTENKKSCGDSCDCGCRVSGEPP